MDRPGVRKVPEGSGEQGKMEETSCEVISGTPMTLLVKGQVTVKVTSATGNVVSVQHPRLCQTI